MQHPGLLYPPMTRLTNAFSKKLENLKLESLSTSCIIISARRTAQSVAHPPKRLCVKQSRGQSRNLSNAVVNNRMSRLRKLHSPLKGEFDSILKAIADGKRAIKRSEPKREILTRSAPEKKTQPKKS